MTAIVGTVSGHQVPFCPVNEDPYATVQWGKRDVVIRDEHGNILFEQNDVEAPKDWSQSAVQITVNKYFYGRVGTPDRETSVRQVVHRIAKFIITKGLKQDVLSDAEHEESLQLYNDLVWLLLHQYGSFNSPVWFNAGLHLEYGVTAKDLSYTNVNGEVVKVDSFVYPRCSACFIYGLQDSIEGIWKYAADSASIFKHGAGVGTEWSKLRSFREFLSGGGRPSGPVSFMKLHDCTGRVIKSGGRTRRAAIQMTMNGWHPDIMEFINCKTEEEDKALALIKAGYSSNFNDEAYSTVAFQNANLATRYGNVFFEAVKNNEDWHTRWVTDINKVGPIYKARDLLHRQAESIWRCGDPGIQYDDNINAWNTCPHSGRINSSNPCGEFVFLDNSACNLASLNLLRFYDQTTDTFMVDRFRRACQVFITAQEILVDASSYPTPEIASNSHNFRPLGLGYSNLGALLMWMGLPYNSLSGRNVCALITALMTGQAYLTSAHLSECVGAFPGYAVNREPMLQVLNKHRDALKDVGANPFTYLREQAAEVWDDAISLGTKVGFRNSQVTLLAPTGTISFQMDCDTTGIEPELCLHKSKLLAGGGTMEITNHSVEGALRKLGYIDRDLASILNYIWKNHTAEGCPELLEEDVAVFDCSIAPPGFKRVLSWQSHIHMMAAAQPFLSMAISKTINMPAESTVEDIGAAILLGNLVGLKCLAIYRDGSKGCQPLQAGKKIIDTQDTIRSLETLFEQRRLPDERQSITHKFSIGGQKGYAIVGMYEDGRPGELFLKMSKEGSTMGGLLDAIGILTSMCLRAGVPLDVLADKLSYVSFEPNGITGNNKIPFARSIVDYVFRWLRLRFNGVTPEPYPVEVPVAIVKPVPNTHIGSICPNCGGVLTRTGPCHSCSNCGYNSGCSG